jgi:hypothetical protein
MGQGNGVGGFGAALDMSGIVSNGHTHGKGKNKNK